MDPKDISDIVLLRSPVIVNSIIIVIIFLSRSAPPHRIYVHRGANARGDKVPPIFCSQNPPPFLCSVLGAVPLSVPNGRVCDDEGDDE